MAPKKSVSKPARVVAPTITATGEKPTKGEPAATVASLTIGETASAVGPTVAVAVVSDLAISSIRLDGGTQSRAALSRTTVAEYAEAMTGRAVFPPVIVFRDSEGTHWLADGFHRVHAAQKNGQSAIKAEVRDGSQRDATLFSVAANATHGLRRTNADKRHAVALLLADAKWTKKSDRWIADTCGVSAPTVAKAREVSGVKDLHLPTTREGRDGKQQPATKPKAKPASGVPAPVALPMIIAMAPADEASALAALQSDIERHALAWTWGPDSFVAALKASAATARGQFNVKAAANG
jgi:hypothetical protein